MSYCLYNPLPLSPIASHGERRAKCFCYKYRQQRLNKYRHRFGAVHVNALLNAQFYLPFLLIREICDANDINWLKRLSWIEISVHLLRETINELAEQSNGSKINASIKSTEQQKRMEWSNMKWKRKTTETASTLWSQLNLIWSKRFLFSLTFLKMRIYKRTTVCNEAIT